MIYEIRTYDVRPGQVHEYENRFAEAYPTRSKYSRLSAIGTRSSVR